jgi:hypothetical protein
MCAAKGVQQVSMRMNTVRKWSDRAMDMRGDTCGVYSSMRAARNNVGRRPAAVSIMRHERCVNPRTHCLTVV